jgi:hypothetical protein
MDASMTGILALNRELDGKTSAYLGIDFPAIGGLPVSKIVGRQQALFDVILRHAKALKTSHDIGVPFIVGVLKIVGSTKAFDFVPVIPVEPSNYVSDVT